MLQSCCCYFTTTQLHGYLMQCRHRTHRATASRHLLSFAVQLFFTSGSSSLPSCRGKCTAGTSKRRMLRGYQCTLAPLLLPLPPQQTLRMHASRETLRIMLSFPLPIRLQFSLFLGLLCSILQMTVKRQSRVPIAG